MAAAPPVLVRQRVGNHLFLFTPNVSHKTINQFLNNFCKTQKEINACANFLYINSVQKFWMLIMRKLSGLNDKRFTV